MPKKILSALKYFALVASSFALIAIADLFASAACCGRAYEPKMPERLVEKHR